ncbi:MAG: asparagine--tRNA ligase [Flavobacteriales bacterium]|nr:asparagine--tRNA ligase [Flavobacteriales bacterium]|tara:strand:+ start:5269 stop:6711 length:1443 start_codon:yes stop_codon:yes gene_type:complete
MNRIAIKDILNSTSFNQEFSVSGWVRNKRGSKSVSFVILNDGSCIHDLQIIVEITDKFEDILKEINTGASISVIGTLIRSEGKGQSVELIAKSIRVLGIADPEHYPIQPKKHSLEFLRQNSHLRFRTKTFSSVFRIRHGLSFAIHKFFNEKNFYYINTPIITSADAEGAGEMFKVTSLNMNNLSFNSDGDVDYKDDFFGQQANLTVSGQLEAELAALGLSQVYTFGPTFRAENSNTSRHLAEFWMVEPEVAFYDLNQNIKLASSMLKYVSNYILENYLDDISFLSKRKENEEQTLKKEDRSPENLLKTIENIINTDFQIISYTDAFNILKNSKKNKKNKFQYPVIDWGLDLQSEHERFLVEKEFKKPIVIIDYPKSIKAFYMRLNDDNKTVGAMDVLFPGIGEIIGGSQREERLNILQSRMSEMSIPEKELWWYLETRKFGTVPHSGFGLGFERLVQFITGMNNIRDVIPFPRFPSHIEF